MLAVWDRFVNTDEYKVVLWGLGLFTLIVCSKGANYPLSCEMNASVDRL